MEPPNMDEQMTGACRVARRLRVRDDEVAEVHVPRHDGSLITSYVWPADIVAHVRRPVVLLLHGSGPASCFPVIDGSLYSPFMWTALRVLRDSHYVVCVEKRAIAFGQHATDAQRLPGSSEEYQEHDHLDARAGDIVRVVEELAAPTLWDGSKLMVIGSSEGASVAVAAADRCNIITHIALFPAAARQGLFLSLQHLRQQLARAEISADQFVREYQEIVEVFSEIRDNPSVVSRGFAGHSFKRWHSYSFGQPESALLRLSIPVFIGIPSLDATSGIDLLVDMLVEARKRNVTWKNYVNYDHGFFEHVDGQAEPRHDRVLNDVIEWLKTH